MRQQVLLRRLLHQLALCQGTFRPPAFLLPWRAAATDRAREQVGGLPIHELNHLELQFLLLNDFRLSVPVEELEAYGSMLVEFYAQEVVAQQLGAAAASSQGSASGNGNGDALYMGAAAR